MEDKTLVCENCHKDFVWTAGEQEFYTERGFSQPKYCKECRDARKAERNNGRNNRHFDNRNN